jgi:hypothetical protein
MKTAGGRLRPRRAAGRPLRGGHLVLAGWLVLAGCSRPPSPGTEQAAPGPSPTADVWFEEVGRAAGIDFRMTAGHRPGRYLMPEIKGGGVGLLDFDGDGWLDIFCVQAGSLYPDATHRPGHKLYRNEGGWKFTDVTERAGVRGNGAFGMGCAVGDFDADGWPDLYVTALGPNQLFRNNSDGTFTDVSATAGVADGAWGASAAFVDYDRDGQLDLIVANYIRWSPEIELECFSQGGRADYCSPLNYRAPSVDSLFRNWGDGTFEPATVRAGLERAYGYGLGVVGTDLTGDGWPDLYVANDATPNQLWVNQRDGTFRDEAMIRGCAVNGLGMSEAGMGIAVVDTLNRGVFDLFITHLVGEANRLFLNQNGYFTDHVTPDGPGATSWPHTSFGVGFFDFDHDGRRDAYIVNGRVKRGVTDLDPKDEYAEPNTLLRGVNDGGFAEVQPTGGTWPVLLAAGRGAAFGDLDNDGDVDVVITNRDGPTHLLRNVAGNRGRWIMFRALDRRGVEAVNAELRLEAGAFRRWQRVLPNQSYCSSNDPRVHFGLGALERVERVVVRWPQGTEEAFGPFAVNQLYLLREGAGRAAP